MPKVASPKYNIKIKYPDVASQWHPTKNGDKKPEDYRPGSVKKVWWKCERNHEWEARIGNRTQTAVPIAIRYEDNNCWRCYASRYSKS